MSYEEHKKLSPKIVSVAIITFSDTRNEENDESGKFIINALKKNGHKIIFYKILKEDKELVIKEFRNLLRNREVQVIITNGGTGISKRDITIECISPFFEKKINGFGEIFRTLTYEEIGSSAIMSRAIAGVAKGKVIFCLPGSINAVKLAMEKIILNEIRHVVFEVEK